MTDFLYKSEDVDQELQPIFEQLCNEFGATCQIWRRVEDFGRQISAVVINKSTMTAVTILLRTSTRTLKKVLDKSELEKIQKHITSGAEKDLTL